ncbi:MAG: HIT family protein [Candidatus Brocadiaceae bacterium]|jgi:histidine triad (HIT) family protein
MADCVFCRIVAGEIPAAKLIETDKVISFLDINPVNPGHALVVPKRHVASFLDLQQDELHTTIFIAKRVAGAVTEATQSPAFNILQNTGEAAGQKIDHVHLHVIPRKPDDGFSLGWRQLEYEEGELEALQESIEQML